MNKIEIFISGAEKNAPEGFGSWRNEVKNWSAWTSNITILDPVEHFNYIDKTPTQPRQCSNYFMWLIDRCDVLLVNLDYTEASVGTGCEVQHAYDMKKPIIGFGIKKETWYEWTHEKCEVIFETYEEALDYILEYYNI